MPFEDSTGFLQPLLTILLLGGVWLVVRWVFKLAMRVFVVGCFIILLIGVISIIMGSVTIAP